MQSIKYLFGKRVRELRKAKNLTQEQLAELVDIDPRNIIKIENAESFPRLKTLEKMLEVFEISASDMFKVEHLEDINILRKKINAKLQQDDELVKLIYKMIFWFYSFMEFLVLYFKYSLLG